MPPKISVSAVKAELCRRSLFEFVKEFWGEIIPEDPVWNWHIPYLCNEIQQDVLRVCKLPKRWEWFEGQKYEAPPRERQVKLEDILVNIPPGTTKSTILSVMLPAWAWTVDPTLRIGTASYSGDLSMGLAMKSRDIIQSDKYRQYFPDVKIRDDSNNKQHYINTKGGERYSTSTGGTIVGIHFHLIIVDDPVNTRQASSEGALEEACDFVNTTLSMRKVDKKIALTIMVMQRLHENDPSGDWLRKMEHEGMKVKHICLPAKAGDGTISPPELVSNYADGYLDPVRLDDVVLAEARMKLGSYGYAGQMAQKPAPDGGGIWEDGWIIPVPDKDFPADAELEGLGTDWDTAYTEKLSNAASAYITSGRKERKMYITALGWFHKEFPALINAMREITEPHYVENKASGGSAVQTLVVAGISAFGVDVAGDKIVRARSATPKAEAGMVFIRASLIKKLLYDPEQGILKFPNGPKKDLADALAQAILRHLGKVERKYLFGWGRKTS